VGTSSTVAVQQEHEHGVTGAAGEAMSDDGQDPRRWAALGVVLVAGFMTLLDVSIVNVALPSIRAGLRASSSTLSWVLSGYALTFGLVLVPSGRVGDAQGRRNVFVLGIALFTVASAAAGVATGSTWLVAARLVQGVAGGIITPQITGLIQQLFRGEERGRAFGFFGATIGISTAIGPLLGGLIIKLFGTADGWRWIFYVNLPVGLIAIVLAFRVIPHRARAAHERASQDLDPVGVGLLGLGVVSLLLPFVQEREWKGSAKWLLVVLAVLLLAGFVLWERRYEQRGAQPVVNLELLRVRSYSFGALLGLLFFAGFTGIFFIFTLFLQNGLGYSALLAGASLTPFALASAVSATIGGRTITRYGRTQIAVGLALVALGFIGTDIAVGLVPGHRAALATLLPLVVAGLGSGLVIAPNQSVSLSQVPPAQGGAAGGVLQTGQRIGAAMGIAAIGSVFFSSLATHRGNYAVAYRHALYVNIAFVLVALAVALADVVTDRKQQRRAAAQPHSAGA
jgi:EmrB/QacA subfamily drug resistance transporter